VRIAEPDAVDAHVAYAIGRTVGSAVVRNRLRRRLRVAVRALPFPPGYYLIGARPAAAERSFEDLNVMLQHIVQRLERMS
jgi:ribonuclease P protein component